MKKRFFSVFFCAALLLSILFPAHTAWADPSSGDGDTYTDPLSGVTFVLPEGWNEVQSNVELTHPFQVQFASQKDPGSMFLYGSVDGWIGMTESERSGHTRSDIDSAFIYAYDEGALIDYMAESFVQGTAEAGSNAGVDDIKLVAYGKNECIEFSISQEIFGAHVPFTMIMYVENGYMHVFLFGGNSEQATKDFQSVLYSLQVPPAEESEPDGNSGSAGSSWDSLLLKAFLFFIELIVTFVIYAVPFLVYRNLIRKVPVYNKKAALIIIILYEIIAFALVCTAMSLFIRRSGNLFIAIIWGWYSYHDVTRRDDSDDAPAETHGGAAPRRPAALALAAVSVLLACSLAGNLIQYSSAAQMQQELERKLEQQLESSNATITAQKADILKLENQLKKTEEASQRSEALLLYTKSELEQAQKEAYNYDLIRSFLTKSDAGYASDQFFASKSVLILSRTGEDRTFSLTTGFSGGECSFSTSGNSALVSFTENAWSGNTTIRVSPKSAGTTYVTFSNTVNSQTFRVLILVTD